MKKLLPILLLLAFASCDIMKKSQKTKSDSDFTEQIKTTTFRKGDTVTYEVPNVILKDTVIYTTSTQGTRLAIAYDNTGKVSKADCFSAQIAESQEINRRLLQQITEKEKEKTEKVDNTIFFVIGGVIVLIFLIAIIVLVFYMKSNQAAITAALNKLS